MESGAKSSDYSSSYEQLSALEGGIAFLDGDSSYLYMGKTSKLSAIYAYYGALVFVENGATVHINEATSVWGCISYEGTIAYLNKRGRLKMTGSGS